MFLGTYTAKFSAKYRLLLPQKLRAQLRGSGEVILTKGLDGCIWGFDKKEWEKVAKLHLEIPITDTKGRALRRFVFANAELTLLDEQGRFIVPGNLLEFGKIKDEAIIIGTGDHFEIWNAGSWQRQLQRKVE